VVAGSNVTEGRTFDLKVTLVDQASPETIVLDYDRVADTFIFRVTKDPTPTIGVVVDDYVMFRVDPTTDEIIGFEVEHFTRSAIYKYPEFYPALFLTGQPKWRIALTLKKLGVPIGRRSEVDQSERAQGLLGSLQGLLGAFGRAEGNEHFIAGSPA
jgi:hypothetical protein